MKIEIEKQNTNELTQAVLLQIVEELRTGKTRCDLITIKSEIIFSDWIPTKKRPRHGPRTRITIDLFDLTYNDGFDPTCEHSDWD